MAITQPASELYLLKCNGLDTSYQNTYWFESLATQESSMKSRVIGGSGIIQSLTYIRPDSKSVKVHLNKDVLIGCNYIMFRNYSNASSSIPSAFYKWYYAFVTSIEYISNDVSEIKFEIDVMQTYLFDYTLAPSFVEREHTLTDEIGDNLVPENLETGDYIYEKSSVQPSVNNGNYLVYGCTFDATGEKFNGALYGGMYSGLYYHRFPILDAEQIRTDVNNFFTTFNQQIQGGGIVTCFVSPFTSTTVDTIVPTSGVKTVPKPLTQVDYYAPINKKLFTYPYTFYTVSTGSNVAQFKYELFSDADEMQFITKTLLSGNSEALLAPYNYRGIGGINYNERITITGFPQASFNLDVYKQYIAENSNRLITGLTIDTAKIVGGAVVTGVTGGIGGALGVGAMISGANDIASTVASLSDKYALPLQNYGNQSDGMDTVLHLKDFVGYYTHIRKEFAKIIDNYFSMFGYACHRVKVPNVHARTRWTFTKTKSVNITLSTETTKGIPVESINMIKFCYNNGITFWTNGVNVGRYDLATDNLPIG